MTTFTPMLATIGSGLPREGDWVFEPKYDGVRVLIFAVNDAISLMSRNGIDKAAQFPEIVEGVRALRAAAGRPFVIDGEIIATRHGKPARFQALQGRMHLTSRDAIEALRASQPARLMAFDILRDGKDTLVDEPWRVRRDRLEALFRGAGRSRAVRLGGVGNDGRAMLDKARRHGWEGVIAKRADARYTVGRRTRAWLKLKIEHQQEFVVGGWTEPRRTREALGAILLGYYDRDGSLVYAGHTGTGFTRESLRHVHGLLSRLERQHSPFTTTPRPNEAVHWTRPEVVVEVKFNEWTADGSLRQPVFLGVRTDKSPREVVREPETLAANGAAPGRAPRAKGRRHAKQTRPARRVRRPSREVASTMARTRRRRTVRPAPARRRAAPRRPRAGSAAAVVARLREIEASGKPGTLELPTGTLEVSNLDKVFFPRTGHTKGDIMRFYATVAEALLPAIADRPLVMKRFPNGVTGHAFYQQRAPASVPDAVRAETVKDEGFTPQRKLIGGDLATLLYSVQLGAISVDPWNSRVQSIPFADYAIIDLDPGKHASFGRVVEVALAVKEVLDDLDLHAVPKTSGASGLHIVLPLGQRVPNDAARALAQEVATRVADAFPSIATVVRSVKRRRRGTIYVDYLQNIRGKTVAGVYAVRAQPTPTVSTPLGWDEVNEDLDPTDFTIDTVPDRLASVGDLWGRGLRRPNRAPKTDA